MCSPMKSLAYTWACAPVVISWPAYWDTLGIIDGVISENVPGAGATGWANAAAGGNVICCWAS